MQPCYAHLIHVDLDPRTMAERVTSEEARDLLLRIRDDLTLRAEEPGWERASLFGTAFPIGYQSWAGTVLEVAPIAGVGYWWDSLLERMSEEATRDVAEARRVVERVGRAWAGRPDAPVAIVTGSLTANADDFQAAWRRRIAYAMGFQASLRRGSLDCYDDWYERLIVGSVKQLDVVDLWDDDWDRLSFCLNLLARLHGTMAYQKAHGVPDRAAPGWVRGYREKVTFLEERLRSVVLRVKGRSNADGRAALRGLLRELAEERRAGIWNVDGGPVWGMGVSSTWLVRRLARRVEGR